MSYLTENQGDKDAENLLTYTEYNINVYDEKDNDWKPMTIKVPDGVNFYMEEFRIAEPYTSYRYRLSANTLRWITITESRRFDKGFYQGTWDCKSG